VFERPGAVTRWPLYLRQAKAVLRAGDETFDERRYGFNGLVEALRYGQKEGLFRLDRDRQGVLRVYPGPALPRSVASPTPSSDSATPPPQHEGGGTHARSENRAPSSGNLFERGRDTEPGGAPRQARSNESPDQDEVAGNVANVIDTVAETSDGVGVTEATAGASEVDAAPVNADAPPPGRASRRRRPGAIAAKPAAKKTAATPKSRGAKSTRARKSAKGKESRGKDTDAAKAAAPDKA
jgi:hypothetical protein